MAFVKRDAGGIISAIPAADADHTEQVADDADELRTFLADAVHVRLAPSGHVIAVTKWPCEGHDKAIDAAQPEVVAYRNRDRTKPWPDFDMLTPADQQKHGDEAALRSPAALRDLALITVELIDKLRADGTIAPGDFTANVRQAYQRTKARVDNVKG